MPLHSNLCSRLVRSGQSGDAAVGEQEGLRGGKNNNNNNKVFNVSCDLLRPGVLTPSPLPLLLLQWIATINNISKRIYLSENAEVRVPPPSLTLAPCVFDSPGRGHVLNI